MDHDDSDQDQPRQLLCPVGKYSDSVVIISDCFLPLSDHRRELLRWWSHAGVTSEQQHYFTSDLHSLPPILTSTGTTLYHRSQFNVGGRMEYTWTRST